MKVLVTGALGFIGSNIAERLVSEGHEVTALDNLHTGNEVNIAKIKEKVRVVKMNSGDVAKIGERFDAIVHQGVYSSSPMYRKSPERVSEAIGEWISILEYARKTSCKLVFASSSSLYNGNTPPFREDMEIKVTDLYTEARYSMERLAQLYADFYSFDVIGLRYFSVYGPHEKSKGEYANLITQFLWNMKAGKRPIVYGDGKQSRDFVYVDDVVRATMLAMDRSGHDIFNVGTGKSTELNEVISKLNSKLGANLAPSYEENRIMNYLPHTLADTTKARAKLGFTAKVGIDEGIERLIKEYK